MPMLPSPRAGERVMVKGKQVPFSFWPTKAGHLGRFRLQSLLFALDPWAIIRQTIDTECPKPSRGEALACLDQARDFFRAAADAGVLEAKPLALYYSYMNLVKAFCLTRATQQSFDQAQHGLSEKLHPNGAELTGAFLRAFPSPSQQGQLQNFDEFIFSLTAHRLQAPADFDVPKLLPQIVPGHRLWAQGANRSERFISVHDIRFWHDGNAQMWLSMHFVAEDLTRLGVSHQRFLQETGMSATFHEVKQGEEFQGKKVLAFEQLQTMAYPGYAVDRLHQLVLTLRESVWPTVSIVAPYRRYYVYLCPQGERPSVLHPLATIYALSYYLGSITRYRPHHYPTIAQGPYGPRVQDFISGQPLQFLYLMASEFAKQDVTKPAIL